MISLKLRPLCVILLCGIVVGLLNACSRANSVQPPLSITPSLQTVTIGVPTLSPTPSITELESFTPSISIDSVNQKTYEEIAEALMRQWLDHFMLIADDSPVQLDDFEIHQVKVRPDLQYLVTEYSNAFVVNVIFSVKPSHFPAPDWLAGNGIVGDNNWVNDKSLFIFVIKVDNYYTIQFWGTSP